MFGLKPAPLVYQQVINNSRWGFMRLLPEEKAEVDQEAPLVYQQVINNSRWGFVRLLPEEKAEVDQEVLNYLRLDPQDDGPPGCGTLGCTGCENDHTPQLLPNLAGCHSGPVARPKQADIIGTTLFA
ncbi:hypothetical protein PHMEG_0005396 [Phytophthora megakarya]|uniref:Uncharacterized protein n=1 Tax=Phytophthora megakarya TaxID=4795 RepID=A0A225WRL0_9STRA|nr:hypothetical protein PHMEG_0005389 [Phytophthora megakarya]OWZ20221.1 hypothetical protein PHMEG_0005396 [Phytophthora megakarya]